MTSCVTLALLFSDECLSLVAKKAPEAQCILDTPDKVQNPKDALIHANGR